MILGEMLNKDVLEEVKSEVIKVENNREPFNKVKVYYRFRANEISIKDRLIKYFFDRMLEARLKKEFSSRNIELIDVICIDKKNIDENDNFILIYKLNDLIDIDKIHIDIIKELVEKGFENEEYVVQATILKNTLIQIFSEEVEVNSEDICTEFIDNFFEDKAIILVKDQCNEVIENIDSINIEDINKLLLSILNNYCKIVLSEGKHNK